MAYFVQSAWRDAHGQLPWYTVGDETRPLRLEVAKVRAAELRAERLYDAVRVIDARTGRRVYGAA